MNCVMVLFSLFVGLNVLGQTTLEGVDWAPGDEGEKLVFGLFVVVSLSGESASDPFWDVSRTLSPDLFVQFSIDKEQFLKKLVPTPLYKFVLETRYSREELYTFIFFAPSFPGF